MGDLGLFALGVLFGFLGPALSLVAGPAVLFVLAIVAGVSDGKRHTRPRWIGSWAPALLGSLVFPAFLMSIMKEQLVEPRASHGGVALSVVLALLSAFAAAFVVLTLAVSLIARRRYHPRDRQMKAPAGLDGA